MNLIACDNCAVVFDKHKIVFPDIFDKENGGSNVLRRKTDKRQIDVSDQTRWRVAPVISDVATAVNLLAHLTDDERVSVFSNFCTYCGTTQRPCRCWNDE